MQDRRMKIPKVHWVLRNVVAEVVGRSIFDAATNSAAR